MKRLRVPAFGKRSKRLQQHGDQVSAASHGGAGWGSGGLCPLSQAETPLSTRAEVQEQATESECGVSVYCSEKQARCQRYCNKNWRLEVTCPLNSRCEYSSFGMNAHGLLREH